jgi:hypothetical protein
MDRGAEKKEELRGGTSRVLKNSFFDTLRAIQGWIANFGEC